MVTGSGNTGYRQYNQFQLVDSIQPSRGGNPVRCSVLLNFYGPEEMLWPHNLLPFDAGTSGYLDRKFAGHSGRQYRFGGRWVPDRNGGIRALHYCFLEFSLL